MKIDGCCALITGASAGIGREFAQQLTGRAGSMVLIARRQQRLEELRDELVRRDPNLNVHIRVVDLAEKSQIDHLIAWLEQEKIDIDFLINNAGLGDLGRFATSDPARIEQIVRVNVLALTLLTRRLLPQMLARRRGAILNVSSSAGFLPIAAYSVYAASKAYVTSFSEGLRADLHGTGVGVCALCPGPVHTEFINVAKRPGERHIAGPEFTHVRVDKVVREGIAAIEADKPLVIPGLVMKLGMFFVRITPLTLLRLASGFITKRSGA